MLPIDSATVPVITFDGPGAVGKGTIAALISQRLNWHYLDSGALYRILAYAAEQAQLAFDDADQLAILLRGLAIQFTDGARLNGVQVEAKIRTEDMGTKASLVAKHVAVRRTLLDIQQGFRQAPGLVADGRDMGTVVFADSAHKFYLTASVEERAKRRFKQLNARGHSVNIDNLFREIAARDFRDQNREVSPLVPAADAIIIDTSALSIQEVLAQVVKKLPDCVLN